MSYDLKHLANHNDPQEITMTVSHTKLLELLGKDISFSVIRSEEIMQFFPNGILESGTVEAVLIHVSGNHEILVGDVFYSLNEIQMK